MKKIITRISICLIIGFLICFLVALCMPLSYEISKSYVFLYRFSSAIEYFTNFLPGILLTSFAISFSVIFGENSQGSTKRFSPAMVKRYKSVMITAIFSIVIVLLFTEVFSILAKNKKHEIINRPNIIKEYIKVGNSLYENGMYERAIQYASAVLELDENSTDAMNLISKSNIELNRIDSTDSNYGLLTSQPLAKIENELDIEPEKLKTSYDYYCRAEKAFENKSWFNAHYYAELGLKLITSKDPNVDKLKEISCQAWNNLTEQYNVARSQEEIFFEQKYKGYEALVQKDDLQAYYIFRYLYENYPEMQRDPDVIFYFEIAKQRIEEKYFYVDETFELERFEETNDLYFSYTRADGRTDIIFFKGMASVKSTGKTIQYLRDFTVITLDKYGNFVRKLQTPYAKLMPVSVKNINEATKSMLEISEKTKFVPYILLKSVGRDDESISYSPKYYYANGEVSNKPEFLILPMDYSDFCLVEFSKNDPHLLPLVNLFSFVGKAEEFGFSQEEYGSVLLNRFLYPLLILLIFVILASFVWDNRLGINQYFKFSWIFSYPFVFIMLQIILYLATFLLRLFNNAIMIMTSSFLLALLVGTVLYLLLIFIASIYFLSRKSS